MISPACSENSSARTFFTGITSVPPSQEDSSGHERATTFFRQNVSRAWLLRQETEKPPPVVGVTLFDTLEKNIVSLFKPFDNNKAKLYQKALANIQVLTNFIECIIKEWEAIEKELQSELLSVQQAFVNSAQDLRSDENKLRLLEATLVGLNQKQADLIKEGSKNESLIGVIRAKKEEEERKRKNAALGLVPFYSLIEGVRTGRPKEIIPFYSQVVGFISLVDQEVEECNRKLINLNNALYKLSWEINSTSFSIDAQRNQIEETNLRIRDFQAQKDLKNNEIQQLWRILTDLRNIKISLEDTLSRCKFLKVDVDDTNKLMEILGRISQEEVESIVMNIKEIQSLFNATFDRQIDQPRFKTN